MSIPFTYSGYENILRLIQSHGNTLSFADALGKQKFIILRHDIEFSTERAYKMAQIEASYGVKASYFVQLTNNAYNSLSLQNISILKEIINLGHEVGLHVRLTDDMDFKMIKMRILSETKILESYLGANFTTFSIHRPSSRSLALNIKVDGLLNAYQDEFFTFVADGDYSKARIKYVSDARHRWNYGKPTNSLFDEYEKIQLLIHPDWWTENDDTNSGSFASLLCEKNNELICTIMNECNHFAPEAEAIINKEISLI